MTVVFINTKKSNSSLFIFTFSFVLILVISFKLSATQTTGTTVTDPCGGNLGRIADPNDADCQIYFYCFYNGFNISYWKLKCPNKLVFRPITRTCVSRRIYQCNQTTTPPSCPCSTDSSSTIAPASPTDSSPTTAPASPTDSSPTTAPASPTDSSPTTAPASPTDSSPITDPASPTVAPTTLPASPTDSSPTTPPIIEVSVTI